MQKVSEQDEAPDHNDDGWSCFPIAGLKSLLSLCFPQKNGVLLQF